MSGPQLAEATKAIDPDGIGVSPAYIGFLTGAPGKRSTRETCGPATASLIARALDQDIQEFFTGTPSSSSMPMATTTTAESSNAMETTTSPPEPLMTQEELMTWLGVSPWWVNEMLAKHGLPVESVPGTGRKRIRRFKQSSVQAWLDASNAAQSA